MDDYALNYFGKKITYRKSVVQSCIVGAKDGDDEVLRAHIVLGPDDMNRKEEIEIELREICNNQLPSYSRPSFYVFCERLPLTAAGKVGYRALEVQENK